VAFSYTLNMTGLIKFIADTYKCFVCFQKWCHFLEYDIIKDLDLVKGILQNNNKTDIKDSNKYSYYSIDPPKNIVSWFLRETPEIFLNK